MLADENDFRHQLLAQFENTLRDRIQASVVCDVACGEGYLARFLVQLGAKHVIGIASATELIATAQERANNAHMIFRVYDAQTLETIADETIDIVVSQLALMDIPDHRGVFRSAYRVLRHNGIFAFSLLHRCFEGPFQAPAESQFLRGNTGNETACVVRHYDEEGYWCSGGTGVRGHMGAYHRTLSTLINDLESIGFRLD